MTTKVVTDDTLGVLGRRYHELFDRVRKGVLDPQTVLDGMQALIEGTAPTGTVVDLGADPFVPEGWTVIEHKKGGSLDLATAKPGLYLAEAQKKGHIGGEALRADLADKPVLNANALDCYLKNPHLIPDDWKGKCVFFWGTVYRVGDGHLYVRCLFWNGGRWDWSYDWLDNQWPSGSPAAVASST